MCVCVCVCVLSFSPLVTSHKQKQDAIDQHHTAVSPEAVESFLINPSLLSPPSPLSVLQSEETEEGEMEGRGEKKKKDN